MKFLVKQQKIEVLEREIIASDQIAFVSVKFVFDGAWKTLHKVVQFTQCEETYNLVLGIDGTTCLLPAELHPGAVKMSLFGYDAESDTTLRATTVPVTLHIRPSGFVADGDTPIPPTPDLYTQLLKKLSEIQTGANGKDGRSAYEIAIENGFVGTVAEWLESLKGRDGKDGLSGKLNPKYIHKVLRNEIANFQRAKKMAVASGTQAFQNFTGRTNNNYMEKVLAQWSMM